MFKRAFLALAGKTPNRDSIKSKVFEGKGVGFGEGEGKLSPESFPSPTHMFIPLPYTIFTPPIQWAETRPLRDLPSHGVLWLLE